MARASRKRGNVHNHLVDGWRLIAADYSRAGNERYSYFDIKHGEIATLYARQHTPELRAT